MCYNMAHILSTVDIKKKKNMCCSVMCPVTIKGRSESWVVVTGEGVFPVTRSSFNNNTKITYTLTSTQRNSHWKIEKEMPKCQCQTPGFSFHCIACFSYCIICAMSSSQSRQKTSLSKEDSMTEKTIQICSKAVSFCREGSGWLWYQDWFISC